MDIVPVADNTALNNNNSDDIDFDIDLDIGGQNLLAEPASQRPDLETGASEASTQQLEQQAEGKMDMDTPATASTAPAPSDTDVKAAVDAAKRREIVESMRQMEIKTPAALKRRLEELKGLPEKKARPSSSEPSFVRLSTNPEPVQALTAEEQKEADQAARRSWGELKFPLHRIRNPGRRE